MLNVEDRLLIHEVLARLDYAVDSQNWDAYLAHLTDDAVLDSGFAGVTEGVVAIREWLKANEQMTSGKRHVTTNIIVDGDGDQATATSYLTVVEREDPPAILATAQVVDYLVKRNDVWKIARHEVHVDPGMMKAFSVTGHS